MGNQVKLLGLMIVEDDLTKLELIPSIIYQYTAKIHLVWIRQASVHIFTEALEICILLESIRLSGAAHPGQDPTAVPLWSQADIE